LSMGKNGFYNIFEKFHENLSDNCH